MCIVSRQCQIVSAVSRSPSLALANEPLQFWCPWLKRTCSLMEIARHRTVESATELLPPRAVGTAMDASEGPKTWKILKTSRRLEEDLKTWTHEVSIVKSKVSRIHSVEQVPKTEIEKAQVYKYKIININRMLRMLYCVWILHTLCVQSTLFFEESRQWKHAEYCIRNSLVDFPKALLCKTPCCTCYVKKLHQSSSQ